MKLMIRNFLILTLSGMAAPFSCMNHCADLQQAADLIDADNSSCKDIIIDAAQYDEATTDEYVINEAYLTNDSLMLIVQYGGGCGTTSFELLTNGYFMESFPVQLDVLLSFKDDDPCEALIQRQICYDLSRLATLYENSYQTTEGTIILQIKGYDSLGYNF